MMSAALVVAIRPAFNISRNVSTADAIVRAVAMSDPNGIQIFPSFSLVTYRNPSRTVGKECRSTLRVLARALKGTTSYAF